MDLYFAGSRKESCDIELQKLGLIADSDVKGTNKVLTAAALTYVASFLASALQVLRLVLISRRIN